LTILKKLHNVIKSILRIICDPITMSADKGIRSKTKKKIKSQNKPQSDEVGKNISSKGGDLNRMACLVITTVFKTAQKKKNFCALLNVHTVDELREAQNQAVISGRR
jgi:hypothetical protein